MAKSPKSNGIPPGGAPSRFQRRYSAARFSSNPVRSASAPNSSYSLRRFGSERTSNAAVTSLNFSSAALFPGFTSGWYFFASRR